MASEALPDLWRRAMSSIPDVTVTRGLSDSEVDRAEEAYGIAFPSDLRECLQAAVPTTPDVGPEKRAKFPDWRRLHDPGIILRLSWPWEGWVFDLEQGAKRAWLPEWGERPDELASQLSVARAQLEQAPRLVPIFGHRYMPAEPTDAGNPVFSVYQVDIIHYGVDLEDYLNVEFLGRPHGKWTREPRNIRFWSRAVQHSDEDSRVEDE